MPPASSNCGNCCEWRRLATAIEHSADSVVITSAEGLIEYVNPAFERITGYSRIDALGKNPRIIKSGVHDEAFYRKMWSTLLSGSVWKGHITNRRKDGTVYQEAATISPIVDGSGSIAGFVAVKRDITRELQLEAMLLEAQKMDAVGRLAASVGRDFNNVLTVINGYCDVLLAGMQPWDSNREKVSEIRSAGGRAAVITRQLLGFSSAHGNRREIQDLNDILRASMGMLTQLGGKNVEIGLSLAAGPLFVTVDEIEIQQALTHLITNARDAMPDGGLVHIRTSRLAPDAGRGRGQIKLSIQDDGAGMDAETAARAFEPFYTTKPVGKGLGLGLSTVERIVRACEGRITIETRPGAGTTVSIFLPAGHDVEVPQPTTTIGGETILLVDDDPSVRRLTAVMLRHHGYTVLEASSAAEALELEAAASEIHLLMTDVLLAGTNGIELAAQLASRRPSMPAIYVSGHSASVLQHIPGVTAGNCIEKPFTEEDLDSKVRRILELSRGSS